MRLNLGVGHHANPDPEVINVDWRPFPGVQVVHDLDDHPWPFGDEHYDHVTASHVFEHLRDPLGFMADVHRVLVPGGRLLIAVPHYQSNNSFTDPTHLRHCTLRTFDYWCHGTQLFNESDYSGDAVFDKQSVSRDGDDIVAILVKRGGHDPSLDRPDCAG